MLGAVVQGSEVLVDVLVVLGDVFVLDIHRTDEGVQGIEMLAEVSRPAEVEHGAPPQLELRHLKLDAGGGLLDIGLKGDVKPEVGLGARDQEHPRLIAVHYQAVVLVPCPQLDCLGGALDRPQDESLRYLHQPAAGVAVGNRGHLRAVDLEYVRRLAIETEHAGVGQELHGGVVNLLDLLAGHPLVRRL